MIYHYISIAYTVISLVLATTLVVRSKHGVLSRFYAFCVVMLALFGASVYVSVHPVEGIPHWLPERIAQFLYALLPFFFLHFMLIFLRKTILVRSTTSIIAIYTTGMASFVLVLLGLIPVPFEAGSSIRISGYIYYLVWMSIYFSIGMALSYAMVGNFGEKRSKPKRTFRFLLVLMLILPTPFTLSLFNAITPRGDGWYVVAALIALTGMVYLVFSHRVVMTTPYQAVRTAVALMNDFIIRTDSHFRIQSVEGAIGSLLGYSPAELQGRPLGDLIKKRDANGHYTAHPFSETMTDTSFDARLLASSGLSVPIVLSVTPFRVAEKIVGFIAVGRDGRDRERADTARFKQEKMFRSLFEENSTPMWLYDREAYAFLAVNRAALTLYGYSISEFLSMDVRDLLVRDGATTAEEPGKADDPGHFSETLEQKHRKRDGSVITISVTRRELEFGGHRTILEMVDDLTEQRRIERAWTDLVTANEFARSIINSSSDMIIAVDMQRRITEFNKAAQRTFGYTRDEVIGQQVDILYAEPERGRPVHESVIRDGQASIQVINRRKSGEVFPSILSASALHDTTGAMIGIMGTSQDISYRQELDRMKSEFISIVSHEIRTPLTSLLASLEILSEAPEDQIAPDLRPLLAIAAESSDVLMRLVNDILDMEKLETGKMVFRNETVHVGSMVKGSITTMQPLGRKHGVSLFLDDRTGDRAIEVDPDRIQQVLHNLLSNAIKFSPAGDCVTVRISDLSGSVRIEVTDHGPGIPEEFRPRVFEKFSQADGNTKKGGTGLGLQICKRIVERLNGSIGFESLPDERTTFFVELPERQDEYAEKKEQANEQPQ